MSEPQLIAKLAAGHSFSHHLLSACAHEWIMCFPPLKRVKTIGDEQMCFACECMQPCMQLVCFPLSCWCPFFTGCSQFVLANLKSRLAYLYIWVTHLLPWSQLAFRINYFQPKLSIHVDFSCPFGTAMLDPFRFTFSHSLWEYQRKPE